VANVLRRAGGSIRTGIHARDTRNILFICGGRLSGWKKLLRSGQAGSLDSHGFRANHEQRRNTELLEQVSPAI